MACLVSSEGHRSGQGQTTNMLRCAAGGADDPSAADGAGYARVAAAAYEQVGGWALSVQALARCAAKLQVQSQLGSSNTAC